MFWRNKTKNPEFTPSEIIDVNSVDEEYYFIDSLLSEAGAPLAILDRTPEKESIQSNNMIDHFTLACTESGIQYIISFRVKYE